jgi:CRISPR/Cas system CMR-associated protein Cmr1 (group 7 of RAMP superfamily)
MMGELNMNKKFLGWAASVVGAWLIAFFSYSYGSTENIKIENFKQLEKDVNTLDKELDNKVSISLFEKHEKENTTVYNNLNSKFLSLKTELLKEVRKGIQDNNNEIREIKKDLKYDMGIIREDNRTVKTDVKELIRAVSALTAKIDSK